jgi:hypothetical protein
MKRFLKMSPPRKFSGKVKPGVGIDGIEGESFTKRRTDPWDSSPDGNFISRTGGAKYTNNESGLRNKLPSGDPEQGNRSRGGGKDVWDNVNANSDDVSPTRGTGPIKYGVDK